MIRACRACCTHIAHVGRLLPNARRQMALLSEGQRLRGCAFAASSAVLLLVHSRRTLCSARAEAAEVAEGQAPADVLAKEFNIVRRGEPVPSHPHVHSVRPSSIAELVEAAADADALVVGEVHDDAEAHRLELELLKRLHEKHGGCRRIVLSLEMFETDVQLVLDEYLEGLITESSFLADARPWGNYADYRGLVEYAKVTELPVVAANAPRRYVGMVGKGLSLTSLTRSSRSHLPPLPVVASSSAYQEKFDSMMRALHGATSSSETMSSDIGKEGQQTNGQETAVAGGKEKAGECPYIGFSTKRERQMLEAQNLWDATMAYSIARALTPSNSTPSFPSSRGLSPVAAAAVENATSVSAEHNKKSPLVLHICGKFHCENNLGIPEHLARYSPDAKVLIAVCAGEDELSQMHESQVAAMADFVAISTGEKSFDITHPL